MAKIKLGYRVMLKDDFCRNLKKGHQGLVVGTTNDDMPLVLFDNYHNGHSGGGFEGLITYLKGYSYERLRKIGGGCEWVQERDLQPICLLKSWKGGKR